MTGRAVWAMFSYHLFLYVPASSLTPYEGFLTTILIRLAEGAIQIDVKGDALIITGAKGKLNILGDNLVGLSEGSKSQTGDMIHSRSDY